MKLNRLVPVLILLSVVIAGLPVSASLSKVAAGAPVFIGERNIDISSGMNGHTVIAWWPQGSDRSGEPTKTVNVGTSATSFTLDPAVFTGYTGTWYTHDTKPDIPVFVLYEPEYNLSVWDVDSDKDITGQSVPMSANITYRIETNLYMALDYAKRPIIIPSGRVLYGETYVAYRDSIFPRSIPVTVGASTTQILKFDSSPFIKSSPYTWANGPAWDRNAMNPDSSSVLPDRYTYTLSLPRT